MDTIFLNFPVNENTAMRLIAAGVVRFDKDLDVMTQRVEETAARLNVAAHELSAERADFGRETNQTAPEGSLFFFGDLAKAYIPRGAKVVVYTRGGKFAKAKLTIGAGEVLADSEVVLREVRPMGFQKVFVYWNPAHDEVAPLVTVNPAARGNYGKNTEAVQISQSLIDKLAAGGKFEWENR